MHNSHGKTRTVIVRFACTVSGMSGESALHMYTPLWPATALNTLYGEANTMPAGVVTCTGTPGTVDVQAIVKLSPVITSKRLEDDRVTPTGQAGEGRSGTHAAYRRNTLLEQGSFEED